jgi:hypothetical protein
MTQIKFEPSNMAHWYSLIAEAEYRTNYQPNDGIKSYLILTLDKFIQDNDLSTSIIGADFLIYIKELESGQREQLRDLGDQCLILAGLFPGHAEKRNVSVNYFIGIGQQAYLTVADKTKVKYDPVLFYDLGHQFKALTQLLHAMRLPGDFRPN